MYFCIILFHQLYLCFSYDFKGVIDYIFGTPGLIKLGVLGPMDFSWFQENKIVGCPFPGIPSDRECCLNAIMNLVDVSNFCRYPFGGALRHDATDNVEVPAIEPLKNFRRWTTRLFCKVL